MNRSPILQLSTLFWYSFTSHQKVNFWTNHFLWQSMILDLNWFSTGIFHVFRDIWSKNDSTNLKVATFFFRRKHFIKLKLRRNWCDGKICKIVFFRKYIEGFLILKIHCNLNILSFFPNILTIFSIMNLIYRTKSVFYEIVLFVFFVLPILPIIKINSLK